MIRHVFAAGRSGPRRVSIPQAAKWIHRLEPWSHTSVAITTSALRQLSSVASKSNAHVKGYLLLSATVRERLTDVAATLSDIDSHGDWKAMEDEIVVIEKKLQDATAWDDAPTALKDSARLGDLRKKLSTYRELADINTGMHELAVLAQESDTQMQGELVSELEALHTRASQYLVTLWLSEPTDLNSAYIDVRSGSGGTEACDFALMLARMYTKWGHSRGFTVQTVDESPGDVAGIKSATLLLIGPYAYAYAQYESGVHRLVRISPFDTAGARHTSFASVRVSPHFDESSDDVGIELNASDLKITTMRSQGAGGQHVNKVESAVRITHIPSGITVTCQQERSQHRNRAVAMSLLRSRLYEVEMRKRAQTKADVHNILPGIGWSSQIRSYVLHPYQLIKDVRTGYEVGTSGCQSVLDGDLGGFMEASLRQFRRG